MVLEAAQIILSDKSNRILKYSPDTYGGPEGTSLHKFFIALHKFWLVWKKYYVIMYT